MALPETDVARVRRWLNDRNDRRPPHAVDQVRFELDVDDRSLTVMECRPPWQADFGTEWTRFPIVRLRYALANRVWQIYWRDRNCKFHIFDLIAPSANIEHLLAEVDADRTGIFCG